MKSRIRDISLADSGRRKIEWVKRNMPILSGLEEEFKRTRPFEGVKISLSVHLEAKTAYLSKVLASGGAQMAVTGSNPLSPRTTWRQGLLQTEWKYLPGTMLRRMNIWSTSG